jgi:hypothetical protein
MKDFVYNDDYFLLDPYVVEGEERLRRFIHNFGAEGPYGNIGASERGNIFVEAQHYLSLEHFSRFCDCIGLPLGSSGFEILCLVGEHVRQSGEVYRLWASAVLRLSASDREAILQYMLQTDTFGPNLRAISQAA